MQPVTFPEANKNLTPSGKKYSDDVDAVLPLPIFTNGEQCVSRWKLSFWERVQVLFNGHLWLQILSGETQPPVAFRTDKVMFGKANQ